jgi:hypothetical protein
MNVDKESTQPTQLGELAWSGLNFGREEPGLDPGYLPSTPAARPETGIER